MKLAREYEEELMWERVEDVRPHSSHQWPHWHAKGQRPPRRARDSRRRDRWPRAVRLRMLSIVSCVRNSATLPAANTLSSTRYIYSFSFLSCFGYIATPIFALRPSSKYGSVAALAT